MDVADVRTIDETTAVATFETCRTNDTTSRCAWHLAITSDLGRTWNDITPPNVPRDAPLTNLAFLDADHGWVALNDCVGGFARLYRTSDGGSTWRHIPLNPTSCNAGAGLSPIPVTDSIVYREDAEPTGGGAILYRSTDGGASFQRTGAYEDGPPVPPPSFESVDDGWMATPGRSSLEHSLDGGVTWKRLPIPPVACCPHGSETDQSPVFDGTRGVAPVTVDRPGGWHVQFDTTADGGETWAAGPTVHVPGRYGPSIGIGSTREWWVAPDRGAILHTTDGGATWHTAAPPEGQTVADIEPFGAAAAWILTSGTGQHEWLFRTLDGGASWRRIRPEAPPFRPVAKTNGDIRDLAAGPDGVIYGTVLTKTGDMRIVRHVPGRPGVTTSAAIHASPFPNGETIAVWNGSVWFAGNAPYAHNQTHRLWRLDARTLRQEASPAMPVPPGAAVATPYGLWVGARRHLIRLDSAGHIVNNEAIPGVITHLAADPSGTRLYVATDTKGDRHDHVVFQERSALTGALLVDGHGIGFAGSNGPGGIATTDAGVWVSQAGGMMGGVQFFRSNDLSPLGPVNDGQGVGYVSGTNAVTGWIAADRLWISDYKGFACADATTGATLQQIGGVHTDNVSNVVAVPAGIFASNGDRLVEISPALPCLNP